MNDRFWWASTPLYLALLILMVVAFRTLYLPPLKPAPASKVLSLEQDFMLKAPTCNSTAPPLWVAVVSSAPNNSYNREQIRRTWGKGKTVFFLLGAANPQLQPLIENEAKRHGDIIQGTFVDSYRNLTFKHVMGLLWAGNHCPGVKFILKTDDDVFVNTPNFENDLPTLPGRGLIFCPLMERSMVKRSFRSKWRVSHEEYSERWYPPYCSGWVILYSPDTALALSNEALKQPYFWIDDVHITGTIAKQLNLTHIPLGDLGVNEVNTEEMLMGKPRKDFMFSLTKPKHFQALWNMVNEITSSNTQQV